MTLRCFARSRAVLRQLVAAGVAAFTALAIASKENGALVPYLHPAHRALLLSRHCLACWHNAKSRLAIAGLLVVAGLALS